MMHTPIRLLTAFHKYHQHLRIILLYCCILHYIIHPFCFSCSFAFYLVTLHLILYSILYTYRILFALCPTTRAATCNIDCPIAWLCFSCFIKMLLWFADAAISTIAVFHREFVTILSSRQHHTVIADESILPYILYSVSFVSSYRLLCILHLPYLYFASISTSSSHIYDSASS